MTRCSLVFAALMACAPDPRIGQLDNAWREAKTQSGAALALAQNDAAYRMDLGKYDRIFAGTGVYRRVPESWDAARFQEQLARHAGKHGLRVEALSTQARTISRRTLPETVPADQRFALIDDDVRGVVEVRFRLAPLDLRRTEAWFIDLAVLDPFLHLIALQPSPDGATVTGETYHFLPPRWPVYVRQVPDLGAILRASGIQDDPAALRSGKFAERMAEIDQELAAVAAALPEINHALGILSESQFRAARYDFFQRTAKVMDGRSFAELLR